MTATALFYLIIGILTASYLFDRWLSHLNAKQYSDPPPEELKDLFDKQEYEKSQAL